MGFNKTKIQWTDYTISPNYHAGNETVLGDEEIRAMLTAKLKPGRGTSKPMVFLGDMTDIFGEWVSDALLDKVFAAMALRPDVIWQVLTKRPERMREYLGDFRTEIRIKARLWESKDLASYVLAPEFTLPLSNCWLGTSVEDQAAADTRIPVLLDTPAAVRFLSCEPLLGPVDISRWMARHAVNEHGECADWCRACGAVGPRSLIDWVIGGGESGGKARPCDIAWLRSLRDQCAAAGVPFFAKQLGAKPYWSDWQPSPYLPARMRLKDRHGGSPEEWPEDMRVRQFPGGA